MRSVLVLVLLFIPLPDIMSQGHDRVASNPAVNYDWREGFINITEFNAGIGLGSTSVPLSDNYFGITTVSGYQFSRNVKAGLGLGIQIHNSGMLFPLYIDSRFSLSAQRYVPFFAAAGGVALSPEDLSGLSRIFINPSAGIRFVSIPKIGITFSTGLMIQSGGGETRSSFVNFRLGVEFKGKDWNL